MKAVLSIPARMKSARLPGKVLAPIEAGGETHAMLPVRRLRHLDAERRQQLRAISAYVWAGCHQCLLEHRDAFGIGDAATARAAAVVGKGSLNQ